MWQPPERITTERLVLRRPKSSDAAAKFEYGHDPEVARYMDWPLTENLGDAAASIERAVSGWESGDEYAWVITVKPDDRAVGNVACRVRDHAVDLGFVIGRSSWGRGYATEAAKAVLDWAATLEGVVRIWATCDVENTASIRVLEKIGMSQEGTLRRSIVRPNLAPGVPRDAIIFSWVREA